MTPSKKTKREAARSLARRAIQTKNQSESDLLILSALSLDPSIDADKLRATWLEKWLASIENRQAARYE